MLGIQVGEKLVLDATRKTDRGPVIKVRAVLPVKDGPESAAWYGLSVKEHKAIKAGDVFDCYLGDFSDAKREGKHKGWMEFVDPSDRKRWDAWKAEQGKKKAE